MHAQKRRSTHPSGGGDHAGSQGNYQYHNSLLAGALLRGVHVTAAAWGASSAVAVLFNSMVAWRVADPKAPTLTRGIAFRHVAMTDAAHGLLPRRQRLRHLRQTMACVEPHGRAAAKKRTRGREVAPCHQSSHYMAPYRISRLPAATLNSVMPFDKLASTAATGRGEDQGKDNAAIFTLVRRSNSHRRAAATAPSTE